MRPAFLRSLWTFLPYELTVCVSCVALSVAWQLLSCRCGALLATTALVAVMAFAPGAARAQDATWLLNPTSGDFNTAANWNPATVPTGTAFFGASNTTALRFSANAAIGGWTFNAGAPAYTFTNNHLLDFQWRRHRH